ncbi:Succinate dehydrogenase cytochrome b560 subunit, mitochondrial [Plasmodiophora brassicae]|uniref:Succinate dehydrogenase cytochrome b560 subunit, mitochondrial n=1 Tax=Plasmodiophora brassicae TaxID=37360 RepID=A0A0G4IJ55_PLABS|nr:hypothetical protein PBRA_003999 [Plasmodiophora brassicae]SPQ96315.1 unnamed protein product [Plasmodiophora brassicae]
MLVARGLLARSGAVVVGRRGLAATAARPLSPHVTIYKFPLAALSSIANRVTGCVLSGVVAGAGLISCNGGDVVGIVNSIKSGAPIVVPVLKLAIAFPLVYHYLGGIRHLYWDATCQGLTISATRSSSVALFATSAVLSLLLAGYTLPKKAAAVEKNKKH